MGGESEIGSVHLATLPVWGAQGWNVALDSPQAVQRAILYTDNNPEKESLPRQRWQMVVPFDPLDSIAAHAAANALESRSIKNVA